MPTHKDDEIRLKKHLFRLNKAIACFLGKPKKELKLRLRRMRVQQQLEGIRRVR